MSAPFPLEIAQSLTTQIDAQLAALETTSSRNMTLQRSLAPDKKSPLAKQVAEIERITQEPPVSFLTKFRKAAQQDVCEKGGVLNVQWQKWKDLASGDVVKSFGPILMAMGFSGVLLESLVVAVGVTVIHIGLTAFCEEFGEKACCEGDEENQ